MDERKKSALLVVDGLRCIPRGGAARVAAVSLAVDAILFHGESNRSVQRPSPLFQVPIWAPDYALILCYTAVSVLGAQSSRATAHNDRDEKAK